MYKNFTRKLCRPHGYKAKHFGTVLMYPKGINLILAMKITTLLLIVSILQVSASTFAQKVTINQKDMQLEQVFKLIRAQSGYNILIDVDLLKSTRTVSLNIKDYTVEEAVEAALKNQNLEYEMKDKLILIKPKTPSFLDVLAAIDVRGRVVDEKNEPMVGAVIKVKGTQISTSTNSKGEFLLKNVDENVMLVISFLGYEQKEIRATEKLGDVKLNISEDNLKEVEINAGYYTVKERERTGNISKVEATTIAQQPISNPLMALQNRVPGLEVTQQSGVPGSGFRIRVRGQSSIIRGSEPLYIIDGVTYPSSNINTAFSNNINTGGANPLGLINPNDIESIEVLKDADATAIYGSRGANGVILITTKKGSYGETRVNGSVFQGFSEVGHRLDLMNTEQYLAMRMEAFQNDKTNPVATDYDVNGVWDKNKYTDWQEYFIGGRANQTNASLTVSGGGNKTNYLIGGNYYGEGTVFRGNFGFKRLGFHSSINFGTIESRFQAGFTATYGHTISNLLSQDPTVNATLAPNHPDLLDQYGQLNWNYNNTPLRVNPMALLNNTIDAKTDNLIGNINLTYRLIKNLSIKASIGYSTIKREELAKSPNISRAPSNNPVAADRTSYFGNNYNNSWIAEPQLNYSTNIGSGKLSALAGMSFQKEQRETRNIRAENFSSDELMDNIASASVFSIAQQEYYEYKYAALFSRLNYNLLDKYFLNLTGRRDGSSRFGSNRRFANFGAIGTAWLFSEEQFFKDQVSFVNFGKLRASYGLTGNDQIGDYLFLQLYENGSNTYEGSPTLITTRISNSDLSWETNKKAEIATELGLFENKVRLQVAWFRNRSSNQLVTIPLSPSVGSPTIQANLPATVQNTGLEVETSFQLIKGKNWDWTSSLNFTLPKNKLLKYENLDKSSNATVYIIGEPLNIRRYYHTYVDTQTGSFAFEDTDGNSLQNDADRYLHKFIGQFFYGGWHNSIRYKRFNLDFLFSFSKQNGNSLLSGMDYPPGYFVVTYPNQNATQAMMNRWQNPGDQTGIAKYTTTVSGRTNFLMGKRDTGEQSIDDLSFIRLKNLSFNYELPSNWLGKLGIKKLDLNLQAQNIFTITKFKGFDPESQTLLRLPPLRTWALGLKFTL
ncbi:TonB-linked SusC/RagA family outer membrane protein [Pedobacter africanus]|uniref:TonB-linked SusC/RagA family outer membrane protein n=1 Tax=Pedobacter africanus TaxID=151894 RepID=A0ACC6L3T4_9SPHI|nr:SusC/RagA family TonB-linked outer membrane protein [Pedobacter africanus]MDR6786062.1 TonB-linked SusC/RagA family outer membrane protein [Pedobacter africanus]